MKYRCYRCNYETDRKSSFINHINKKKNLREKDRVI